jgi:hypothetical protein
MKSLFPLLITLIIAFSACEGLEKIDSDFKINPLGDPESVLRSFFLAGDSTTLEIGEKPETDVPAGKNYGITLISGDSVWVKYTSYSSVFLAIDTATPATAKIKNIYITSTARDGSYWKCAPQPGSSEVKSFTFTISNTVKSGRFPLKIWARLLDYTLDTNNIRTYFYVTVPQKDIFVSLIP